MHLAGFGLDFVWPYLADYPENKVAVIDDTCIMRPTHILGPSPLFEVFNISQSTYVQVAAADITCMERRRATSDYLQEQCRAALVHGSHRCCGFPVGHKAVSR